LANTSGCRRIAEVEKLADARLAGQEPDHAADE
jgi:hypothetical protein